MKYDEFHNFEIIQNEIMLVNMYKDFNKSDFLKVDCKNEILTESIILHRDHFLYSWKDGKYRLISAKELLKDDMIPRIEIENEECNILEIKSCGVKTLN